MEALPQLSAMANPVTLWRTNIMITVSKSTQAAAPSSSTSIVAINQRSDTTYPTYQDRWSSSRPLYQSRHVFTR
jgi:hypothetical protein